MSNSREDSPDWLRSFQARTQSPLTLSSNSDSSPNLSPSRDNDSDFLDDTNYPKKGSKQNVIPLKKKKAMPKIREGDGGGGQLAVELTPEKHVEHNAVSHSVWTLSSDSESCADGGRKKRKRKDKERGKNEDALLVGGSGESPLKILKEKSPQKGLKVEVNKAKKEKNIDDNVPSKGNENDIEIAEEDTSDKQSCPSGSTSRLPLVLSDKVQRLKALVECEGDTIDLSGDIGAVGRVVITDDPSGNSEMYFDLKGTIYKTAIVPSRTFCVVSFGQSEAKIEAIMNDFIQLKPQSNVYEAETMVEGTLEGFSFDLEDEAEKMPKIAHQTDQNDGIEVKKLQKAKGKAAKSSGAPQKKGKTAGAKPQQAKKVRKKTQVSKKVKTKK